MSKLPPIRKSKAVLDNLPANQAECLERWLFDDKPALTFVAAKDRLWSDFNVKSSKSAVGEFYKKCRQERVTKTLLESVSTANRLKDVIRNSQGVIFESLLELVGQDAFERKMRGEEVPIETLKDLSEIASVGLRAITDGKKLQQTDQRIEIERQKLARTMKSDIEKGLDAVYEELKTNPAALALFSQFKAVIAKATEAAA